MNLKTAMQRKQRRQGDSDLNLTAIMNVFLIIIPFLLLTASFVRIAVLEMSLPNLDRIGPVTAVETRPKNVILNILLIRETGFELKSPDLKFAAIEKSGANYNWARLKEQLDMIKQTWPQSEEIIISPEDSIRYEVIIHVMDRCRDAGFPTISISG